MEGIIKSLAELVGAISSPIQVITVFIIVVAIVAVFIIKRGGFHAVLESSRRKWSRRTFLIVLAASIFFVLLLLIIVIVGLVQLDKIDLLKSVEKPGSDLLDIPETAVVLADEEYRQLVDRARRAFDEQNYEETAVLYQQLSAAVADNDTSVGDYQGLVTASLFGAGRHEEGLEYLCGLYQGQKKADR